MKNPGLMPGFFAGGFDDKQAAMLFVVVRSGN
jgi:hypothetical protein